MKAAFLPKSAESLLTAELLLLASALCLLLVYVRRRGSNQPSPKGKPIPGPTPWPVVGNIPQVGLSPHVTLTRMRDRYGDVFRIRLGSVPVVVIAGLDTAKRALVKHGDAFAGRPAFYTLGLIGGGNTLSFSPRYDDGWKARKKLARNALRKFCAAPAGAKPFLCLLERHVCEEAAELVQVCRGGDSAGFDPVPSITCAVANVMCALVFGKRYRHGDPTFLRVVEFNRDISQLTGAGTLLDFFPVLRYLPNPSLKAFKAITGRLQAFMEGNIKEHYSTYQKDHVRDITDSFISLCAERNDDKIMAGLSDEQVVATVMDIFAAGFDTIIAGITWSLIYLCIYPDIQKTLQKEIDEKIGGNRAPVSGDRNSLSQLEAFIMEMFRHSSYLPFTIPHSTTQDVVLDGFFIPRDTCVFINQYQINHDPAIWANPESFDPGRFLSSESGEVNKELTEKVQIFGLGKRRCLGDTVAQQELFIFLSTLLQNLSIASPQGLPPPDPTPIYSLVLKPARYRVCITPRV
uniref:Cytochrome P450 1A n=1 Tax=Petromyzon marinus TaxID=7757 RepID=A0AAJ7TG12_PETMA|nr:cytochrome P450 1A1-like [Petromyzon marinus]XP_032816182.1 cytochrome P450 1A1-like [Petromyzon marinus]